MLQATTPANALQFSDISRLVPDLFRTWTDDGEERWARYAWSVLERNGLTRINEDVDRSDVVVRLLALATLGKTFYVYAFGEGDADDWTYELGEAVDHPQGIDRAWLREQARAAYTVDEEDEKDELNYLASEAMGDILSDVVRGKAETVGATLRSTLGDAELFASLYMSAQDGAYPLDSETISEIVNDPDGNKIEAYGWIQAGMYI